MIIKKDDSINSIKNLDGKDFTKNSTSKSKRKRRKHNKNKKNIKNNINLDINKIEKLHNLKLIPNKYDVYPYINEGKLLQNGFKKHLDYYSLSKTVNKFFQIKINVYINEEDNYLIPIVTDNHGTYAPFYNPELRHNNKVCENVIKEYNKFMDSLVTKKILIKQLKENNNMGQTIKIKYFTYEIERLRYIDGKSDWIDLRAAEDVELKAGEFKLIPLGIAMQLPKGYEAHIVPRSSTFKNFGVIQTNHQGVVDESYCGDNDQWFFPAYALRDTKIKVNDRICQFRIVEHQPSIEFDEVLVLDNEDRSGHGSTGKQ